AARWSPSPALHSLLTVSPHTQPVIYYDEDLYIDPVSRWPDDGDACMRPDGGDRRAGRLHARSDDGALAGRNPGAQSGGRARGAVRAVAGLPPDDKGRD